MAGGHVECDLGISQLTSGVQPQKIRVAGDHPIIPNMVENEHVQNG